MNEKIFREKSLEKIQSPEDLNEYIVVTKPSVWLILGAVLIYLIGTCIWGIFGTIESTQEIGVVSDGQKVFSVLPAEDLTTAQQGEKIRIKGIEYGKEDNVIKSTDLSKLNEGTFTVYYNLDLPEGNYNAEIILETIHPFDFMAN